MCVCGTPNGDEASEEDENESEGIEVGVRGACSAAVVILFLLRWVLDGYEGVRSSTKKSK